MSDSSIQCDVPDWVFDPLNPGPGFSLEPNFASEEEMLYRSHFGYNDFDMPSWQPLSADSGLGYEFPVPAPEKTIPNNSNGFPNPHQPFMAPVPGPADLGLADKHLSRFANFHPTRDPLELGTDDATRSCSDRNNNNNLQDMSPTLDDLLRAASQVAKERALYMNVPTSPPSSHPCMSSPSDTSHRSFRSSSASETDWERDQEMELAAVTAATTQVYRLPADWECDGDFSPIQTLDQAAATAYEPRSTITPTTTIPGSAGDQKSSRNKHHHHHHHHGLNNYYHDNSLTPLEMPDGTTRFTANWLPVDPEGGFTIHTPAATAPTLTAGNAQFDLDFPEYPPHHQQYHNAFICLDAGLPRGV